MITPNNEAQQTKLAATMMIVEEGVMVSLGVRQISENFNERKTEILDITKSLTEVKTETQNDNAQECYKSLWDLLKRLVGQESSLKKPLNDARCRITKIVSDASVDIEQEMVRLKTMIGEFSEEKIRERQRIVDEIANEQKRVDMERNALIEEMNRLSKAGDTKGVDSVLDDLAFVQTPLPIEVPSVSSVCGKIVRDFKVVNEGNKWKEHTDMLAFVAFAFAHPEIPLKGLIKIEIKRQDFLEALKDKDFLPNGADGIEIFERISTTIR